MENGHKIDLGKLMTKHFQNIASKEKGKLFGGIYVTKLAKYFGVSFQGLKGLKNMEALDKQT